MCSNFQGLGLEGEKGGMEEWRPGLLPKKEKGDGGEGGGVSEKEEWEWERERERGSWGTILGLAAGGYAMYTTQEWWGIKHMGCIHN